MFTRKKGSIDFLALLMKSADNTLQAAELFRKAMADSNPPATYLDALKEMETTGDHITHEIYAGLSRVFITPIDREDIIALAAHLDDVMDGIEASISRFDYLNVTFTNSYMQQFAEVLVSSCLHILNAMELLSKKKYNEIREHTVQINLLENEGDRLMREGIREVFTNPTEPYHDFKLKELYERLEQTTDACEDVADILESIILKYA